MANNNIKKSYEVDVRLLKIIDEEFKDFEKYLGMPQEKKVYERKRKEYFDKIIARAKEELSDGRTTDTASAVSAD